MKKTSDTVVRDVERLILRNKIRYVSMRVCDLPGHWFHFTVPIARLFKKGKLDRSFIEEGIAFDGSSPEGFKSIETSDTLAIPDLSSAVVDPVSDIPTLSIICTLKEPADFTPYWRDPRSVALRAQAYLEKTKIADTAYFGPEIEFFIFDSVSWKIGEGNSSVNVVSREGGVGLYEDEGNVFRVRTQEGYFAMPPGDMYMAMRAEMVDKLTAAGMEIERDTHERATAGSAEIDIKYDNLIKTADNVLLFKYIVKNVAYKHGKMATFMPKPLFGHNGSGMHTHNSLWKNGKPVFYDGRGKYHNLSEIALYYIGGLLTHAKALTAFTNPSVNSYKRLLPGFEAPTTIAFGYRNRSTCCRIPAYPNSAQSRRVEFRIPDPSANPYLCFSAILMAGLDGIKRKLDPVKLGFGPLEKSGYDLTASESKNVDFTPASLEEALNALQKDHAFLLEGQVFTKDFVNLWLEYKRAEIAKVFKHPTPADFEQYFDC